MGFLSQYSGTDIIDLGNSYSVTMKRFLSGDCLERAEAARVKAVALASQGSSDKTVRVETTTDVAAYTEILLEEAIVGWNLTDEMDQMLPLDPPAKKLESIRRLPGPVRKQLREKVESNIEETTRTPEDQKTFRQSGDLSTQVG